MNLQNSAKVEKGYIEKVIGIRTLPDGDYEIEAKAIPTGKKKEEVITMRFTQTGLTALVGCWLFLCERGADE